MDDPRSIVAICVARCALLESFMIQVVICGSAVIHSAAWHNLFQKPVVEKVQRVVEKVEFA
jgi:hypothetical protein